MAIPDVTIKWMSGLGGGATAGLKWGRVGWDAVSGLFIDAHNERVAAALWQRGPWADGHAKRGLTPGVQIFGVGGIFDAYEWGDNLYSPTVPVPEFGDNPLLPESFAPLQTGGLLGGLWARLQQKIGVQLPDPGGVPGGLMAYFAEEAGSDWFGLEGGPVSFGGGAMSLPAHAFRRRFPREIWSLSNPGQKGQVARFAVHLGTPDTQSDAPATFPFIRPGVRTPDAELQHAGKTFKHDGAGWVETADPSLFPDVVELYGFAEEGDTFGPWNAEDLRTQYNRFNVTFRSELPGYSGLPPPGATWRPHSYYSLITMTAPGDAYSFNSFGETATQDEEPYTFGDGVGDSFATFGGIGIVPMAIEQPGTWLKTEFRVYSDRLPRPGTGATCVAQGYVWARAILIPGMPFDALGYLVTENSWTPLGPPVPGDGSYSGDTQRSSATMSTSSNRGWIGMIGLLMKWKLADGGFKFSPFTPVDDA